MTTNDILEQWLKRLLANVERVRCHIAVSELCGICGGGQEDVEHVLHSCIATKGVWMRALSSETRETFFSLTFYDWLCTNLFDASFMPKDGVDAPIYDSVLATLETLVPAAV
ncbi:hypothetical protein V6N13_024108 [Hibiscus sabdariffa]|uniref:Reverse transcriptase zinc-binding domain-containing protein n=1 Tax=Hibiscus sabdariffa TaxID=183260 RepID=A0ABR2BWH6_9ROSI